METAKHKKRQDEGERALGVARGQQKNSEDRYLSAVAELCERERKRGCWSSLAERRAKKKPGFKGPALADNSHRF